jgi:23S rRNA (uridine2552-2'-O)-methyltransferase
MRLVDARRDQYRRLAKDQGYRARSAYKLLQINRSCKILKKGDKVVDLGCAPGGWLQVAVKEVGLSGKVVGLDLKTVVPIVGATILQGSIEDPNMVSKIAEILGCKADIVLSDLAPNVSGVWELDHARQLSLSTMALDFAQQRLRAGGSAVFKVFEGEMLNDFRLKLRNSFGKVNLSKPLASRQESSELYMVCLDLRN